jgi:para-aminobenzoate synthetase component 1
MNALGPVTVRRVPWVADVEAVFARLAARRHAVWLDSAGGPAAPAQSGLRLARWSVLAAEPAAVIVHDGGAGRIVRPDGGCTTALARNPFDLLRAVLADLGRPDDGAAAGLPYGPGLYGYLSYDLAPYVEPKAGLPARRDISLPDLWFGLYETVLLLDHVKGEAFLVGSDGPAAEAILDALATASDATSSSNLRGGSPEPPRRSSASMVCNFTREEYESAVARAREYIAAGDIFQVNLSRRFTVAAPAGDAARRPADLYLQLRRANPAPYAAYVGLGEGRAVLSSSPELFLDLRGGRIITRPIKGTRPLRPGDEAFNARMRDDLLASSKDRAELVMIVDLERNDLGRVAEYGTVRVTEPRTLEGYAAVYHTVATVEGRLHEGRDVTDLLKATFPGGSITGAPKVRAMQIIAELEPTCRSVYTGAVGYLGPPTPSEPAGRCTLNVAIRTLIAAGREVHVQVGGGIVADSAPEAEFHETTDKARAMLAALGLVV